MSLKDLDTHAAYNQLLSDMVLSSAGTNAISVHTVIHLMDCAYTLGKLATNTEIAVTRAQWCVEAVCTSAKQPKG